MKAAKPPVTDPITTAFDGPTWGSGGRVCCPAPMAKCAPAEGIGISSATSTVDALVSSGSRNDCVFSPFSATE